MATTNENESLIDLLEQDVFDAFFTAAVDTAAAPPVAEVNMGGVTGSELLRATSPAWELGRKCKSYRLTGTGRFRRVLYCSC